MEITRSHWMYLCGSLRILLRLCHTMTQNRDQERKLRGFSLEVSASGPKPAATWVVFWPTVIRRTAAWRTSRPGSGARLPDGRAPSYEPERHLPPPAIWQASVL
jgi:hypothetical protein